MAKVEVKSVKHAAWASEETTCFRCTVYIDGVKKGEVSNDGKGGAHIYVPWRLEGELALIAKDLPAIDISFLTTEPAGTRMIAQTADSMIDALVEEAVIEKSLRGAFRSRLLYTRKGKPGLYQSAKMDPAMLARAIESAATFGRDDIERVLNTMPMTEAVAIYRTYAAGR